MACVMRDSTHKHCASTHKHNDCACLVKEAQDTKSAYLLQTQVLIGQKVLLIRLHKSLETGIKLSTHILGHKSTTHVKCLSMVATAMIRANLADMHGLFTPSRYPLPLLVTKAMLPQNRSYPSCVEWKRVSRLTFQWRLLLLKGSEDLMNNFSHQGLRGFRHLWQQRRHLGPYWPCREWAAWDQTLQHHFREENGSMAEP